MAEKKENPLAVHPFLNLPFFEKDFFGFDTSGLSISEDKDHVYVEAQLPGLKSDDIELYFENGVLWIRGEKKEEEEDKKKRYYRRASSSFSYRVHVPGRVEEKKEPKAFYGNGVLKVVFQKSPDSKSKKIPIKDK